MNSLVPRLLTRRALLSPQLLQAGILCMRMRLLFLAFLGNSIFLYSTVYNYVSHSLHSTLCCFDGEFESLANALSTLGSSHLQLKEEQKKAVQAICEGRDVFVWKRCDIAQSSTRMRMQSIPGSLLGAAAERAAHAA